jgi:hypothetical protein
VNKMRTLRTVVQYLTNMPRGFSADGRALGIGLDAALQAQRAHGADVQQIRPSRRPVQTEDPYSRAS